MGRSVVNDSYFKLIPGRAAGYYDDEGQLVQRAADRLGRRPDQRLLPPSKTWPGGTRTFTPGQVGGQAVIDMMHQPGRLNDGTELDYALGLMVGPAHQHRGWQMVEHGGSQGGYSSWMVRFPELHLSVVVLFNHFLWNMREYALQVADLFLEDNPSSAPAAEEETVPAEAATPIELSAEQLADKAGTYYSAQRAALRHVTSGRNPPPVPGARPAAAERSSLLL